MKRFSFFLIVAMAWLTVGTSAEAKVPPSDPQSPSIVGGEVEYGYYQVGWLHTWYRDYPSGPALCTATLVGEHLLLTAAHCLEASDSYGPIEAIYFGSETQAPSVSYQEYPDTVEYYRATEWMPSLEYTGDSHGHDVGLVLLDPSVEVTIGGPLPITNAPLTEADLNMAGLAVGYGRSIAQVYASNGTKRSTPLTVSDIDTYIFSWLFDSEQGEGSGCKGDSGGPVLYLDPTRGPIVAGDISGPGQSAKSVVFCRDESIAVNIGADLAWIQSQADIWGEDITLISIP